MRITFLTALSFYAVFRHSYIDSYNILWYIRIIIVLCAPFAGLWSASHTLLSLYLRSTMLPSEIRVIAPLYFNDYAARNSLAAVSTCTPLCRRAMMCLYLRHQAFRSEQSRHGWKAINSFSLWLRTRSMSKCASRKTGGHQNWTILQTQEGSYEAETAGRFFLRFCLLFCRGTCHRRDTAGKESAPKSIRRRSGKEAL